LRAMVVSTIRPDTIFIRITGRRQKRQSADGRGAGSNQQDPAVQSVWMPRPQGQRRS
jgi:hypothetical protein